MVAQLRDKPGGAAIPVTIGDMAETRVEGEFRLVYLVDNAIGNLETQDRQVAAVTRSSRGPGSDGSTGIEIDVAASDHGSRARALVHGRGGGRVAHVR